jgi:hypothetical protein
MTKKGLSREDHGLLLKMLERYSKAEIVEAMDLVPSPARKVGAPTINLGNFAAVYGYVEWHKKLLRPAGSKVGVDGACDKLKRVLDKYTVNCRTTKARLRSMYYEAQKKAKTNATLAAAMKECLENHERRPPQQSQVEVIPMLLFLDADGNLSSPIVDMLGRGGRETEKNCPKTER